tara:strand:+ start:2193 stop:2960 length:768 start_codon:yes stop_codon:yes gene_type:complete
MYSKILKKISKKNSRIYNLKNESLSQVFFCRISYLITPFFIILNTSPNIITFINFIFAILSIVFIFIGSGDLFNIGIMFYFLYRIVDFCDGSVARHYNKSTFYGRFIDGVADIFLNAFLVFSLSFYSFKIFESFNLLALGCIAAILTSFDSFIYDKYAALARWSNSENKAKVLPYIKKTFMPKLPFLYNDLITILLFLLPFLKFEKNFFFFSILSIFLIFIISALQTLVIHLYFAFINFNLNAKVKNRSKTPKKP